jgi:hypothetical protein
VSTTTLPPQQNSGQAMAQKTKDQTTALERQTSRVPEVVTTPAEFSEALAYYQQAGKYNVLCPIVQISGLPEMHRLIFSQVMINPDPAFGEVYQDRLFAKEPYVAPTKVALSKLALMAGLSSKVDRVDSGTVQFLWSYKAVAEWTGFDGMRQSQEASKTWDLRDGSPVTKGMSAAQLEMARYHGDAGCESRAINRAIRQALGTKQKYHRKELERPFVVVRLQWVPDMSIPAIAAAVTHAKLGSTSLLYPNAPQLPAGEPINISTIPPEKRPVTVHTPVTDDDEGPELNERPFDETEAEAPKGVLVSGVSQVADTDDYFITTDIGRLHTSDRAVAKSCNDARKAGVRIRVETERKGDVVEILEVLGTGATIDKGL